jgi:hypothetical protein
MREILNGKIIIPAVLLLALALAGVTVLSSLAVLLTSDNFK